MIEVVLATANEGKIAEIVEIMEGLPVTFITKDQMPPWPEIVESGDTYLENALIKARALVEFSGKAAIADDSGIEIDALDGAPEYVRPALRDRTPRTQGTTRGWPTC